MKFAVLQENLVKKLEIVSKALPTKNTSITSLNGFLFTVKTDEIKITGSDLETTITTKIPGKAIAEGEALINAKTLLSFVSSLGKEKITFEKEEKGMRVESARTKINLKVEASEEFPKTENDKTGKKTSLPKEIFENAAKQVCFAASNDEARAVLTGVYFGTDGENLNIVATDGFRMSYLKHKQPKDFFSKGIILPARTVVDLVGILKNEEKKEVNAFFAEESKQAGFETEETRILTRTIEGSFPDFEKILPREAATKMFFNRAELLQAIKIASVFARDAANIIKLINDKDGFYVSSSSPQIGENKTKLDVKIEGEKEVSVAFNFRFLLDFLNSGDDEEVTIESNGTLAPGVFKFAKQSNLFHVIMPVRLQEGQNS